MFGMGFTEILIIAVIAILFIGPDKLPGTLIDIAKFFKNMKSTIGSVKETLEQELNVSDIKREALEYKAELDNAKAKLSHVTDVQSHINEQIDSVVNAVDETPAKKEPSEPEIVTFKKKTKNTIEEDTTDV